MSSAPQVRRQLIALSACVAASLLAIPAVAQPARSYAVLSLAADKITLVGPQMSTGSHIDRNFHQVVDMPDDSLDITAVQAAEAAIKQAEPAAAIELFSTRNAKTYAAASYSDESNTAALLAALQPFLANTQASHFLLISKHRDDARFQLHREKTGIGKLAGVGFYVDERMELIDSETGANLQGFFAPYAVLKFRVIDIAARKIVREAEAQATKVHAGPLNAASAWSSLTPDEKAQALQRMIRQAVSEGVGKVLAQR